MSRSNITGGTKPNGSKKKTPASKKHFSNLEPLESRTLFSGVQTFSALDAGVGPSGSHPNANTAAAQFDAAAAAIGNESVITFEGLPTGGFNSSSNLVVAPGVTMNGINKGGNPQLVLNAPSDASDPPLSGFNTTAGGSEYVNLIGGTVTLTFASPTQFFGAYFTGVQTFLQDQIDFSDGSSQVVDIPGAGGGGVAFAGFVDPGAAITSVTINAGNNSDWDAYGMDDARYQATSNKLAITQQPPATSIAYQPLSPDLVVDVDDENGNLLTTDNSTVTLTATDTVTGAVLPGTFTAQAQGGVATFSNVAIKTPGQYTFTATDGGDASATSSAITVNEIPTSTTINFTSVVATAGNPLTLTASVSAESSYGGPGVPTGTVTFYNNGIAIGSATVDTNIPNAPPAYGQAKLTITAPAAGTYSITASYAGDDTYASSNSAAFSLVVATPSPLDPGVQASTFPGDIVTGQDFRGNLTLNVTNDGTTVITDSGVYVYLDTGTALDGGQILITSTTKHFSIKPGKKHQLKFNIHSLPVAVAAGTYDLLAEVVDTTGLVNVTTAPRQVQVAAPFIDLSDAVAGLTRAAIKPGKTAAASVTVTNQGNITARGPVVIELGLTTDGTTFVAEKTSTESLGLLPGAHREYHFSEKIPTGLAAGSYTWMAVIDPSNSLDESGTTNNTATSAVPIAVADLTIGALSDTNKLG